jgi:hypothetical protein
MAKAGTTKLVTGKVRFSYAHVFDPVKDDQGRDKWSVSLIISKSDKDTIAKINAAIDAAKEEGKSKFGGKIPAVLKGGLRDGDLEKPDDAPYKNSFFVNANTWNRPGVVDQDVNPIISPDEFYSGCYGRASISFYAYDSKGSKGIACGLNNLQKLEDGDRLGGGPSAADDFAN